jgi:2-polyprenyl-3-methyl-5-hydroxy-6-metoxy-1,4-benzoquinol methylase
MTGLTACPSCGSRSLRAFAFTVPAERHGDMHVAQTRCRDCDLVFSNPVAEADDLARYYNSAYYEEATNEYNPDTPNLEASVRARVAAEEEWLRRAVLPYVAGGGTFLEIGPGYGGLLAGARELGFTVSGVEPSERVARFARDVMKLDGVRHAMFNPLDWPEASFDVIYSYMVIEHVSDLHAFTAGLYRLLKPGGITIVGTENHHNVWVMVRRIRSWLKGRRLPEFQTANHHTFYFSDHSLRVLFAQHGLQVFKCQVFSPSLAEKLPRYTFRTWYSKLAFYAMHYADAWTGRGGRVLVWCRKPL